ncbi:MULTISPECIES: acetyl-CoA carboxylase carboxyltransferase subunit alpha [Cetobacterium]|jgi:acetyl-CoA carboxylase carboxyl transferase subunit alpha|uniref:Acetyl-coenzyme A carboxylase carboxyl transferase subunit alpha n=1 Tax=Candidatus Cetobacterium colombiensis TaxID=3073100 RepID=A0ABU4WBI9_9FUSO|nr:acetyl-CoA carboxylase carboxyltransferase subunit alpha [Candidatus Cetobacterium colombiensis]MDX8336397.1 acetyl-CoA carboxylase carboxyltransferase subunit alpha [Candidatus Cetobacterium colombiensis]
MKFNSEILDLETKIVELKNFSKEKNIDLSLEIEKLSKQRDEYLRAAYENLTDWDRVSIARHPERPYTLDYIENMTTDFIELHGDRLCKDDAAIVGGLCKINDQKVMIIGHQKGRTIEENIFRNFGMASPEGYRKALRLFKMAERFSIPIVNLIDTAGAYPGIEAEKHGQGEAIARNLLEMAGIKVPIVSIVIGEGGSGGALALGVADKVYMMENAVYSVISPEGCAAILYKDSSKAPEAANNLKISGQSLQSLGIIDGIVKEPLGGAHRDYKCAANDLKSVILSSLSELSKLDVDTLLKNRYNKFRKMGNFIEKTI